MRKMHGGCMHAELLESSCGSGGGGVNRVSDVLAPQSGIGITMMGRHGAGINQLLFFCNLITPGRNLMIDMKVSLMQNCFNRVIFSSRRKPLVNRNSAAEWLEFWYGWGFNY